MPDLASSKLKPITKLQQTAINTTLEQAKHEYQLDDLATKRDLKELELKVDAGIRELELKVAKDIAESKAELVRWVVGVGVLQMTLIVGLMLKLTHSI
ncbi:MAG: DUF1640 domain-containing protein [Methylobacter sp.]